MTTMLSELGELDYRSVRLHIYRDNQGVLTESYEQIIKPISPLPHNVGLTKSQRKNLKRRIGKKEQKPAVGYYVSVEHRPP